MKSLLELTNKKKLHAENYKTLIRGVEDDSKQHKALLCS